MNYLSKLSGLPSSCNKNIGSGLLESVYENALAYDLREGGFDVEQQVSMPFV